MNLEHDGLSRRGLMVAGTAAAATMLGGANAILAQEGIDPSKLQASATKGNINHSVCLWCYKVREGNRDRNMTVAEMAPIAKKLGLKGIDLVGPKDFPTLKEHGLACSMTSGVAGGIENGLNRRENHDNIVKTLTELIDANAAAGFPNVICFSGNRKGQNDEEGIKICTEGLKKVMAHAEQKKVNIIMELLNSKVNHADYQCDNSKWGIELCKSVGSERFKLLYDIYHMQIMEGDVIRTIQKSHQYFGHYHTGGNPGRNEIDESQELYYPAIMKAIVSTGFKGYVAQEFIPKKQDRIASLAAAVKICDV